MSTLLERTRPDLAARYPRPAPPKHVVVADTRPEWLRRRERGELPARVEQAA